jgi:hypothetical protein
MKRSDEILDTRSCWNKAERDELIFILLGRDVATPNTIRAWVIERLRLGRNKPEDDQISEALGLATRIEKELMGQ